MIAGARQWRLTPAAALVAVLLHGALATPVQAQAGAGGEASARQELSEIRSRIQELQRSLEDKRRGRDSATADLRETEGELARIATNRRRIAATTARVNARAEELELRERALSLQVSAARAALARQLRVAYAIGHQDTLKLILNGERAGDVPRLLRYHEFMSRKGRAIITELGEAREALTDIRESLDREAAELDRLGHEQALALEHHRAERDRRRQILARIERELGDEQARLARLAADRQRLERLVHDLEQAISDIPRELEPPRSFASLKGRLPWPVRGRHIQRFGAPREHTGMRWQGVVVAADSGQEVRAVANGRVVFADWLRGFGLMIILDHGSGFMSLYGHNEALLREAGEWVNPGDPIATVGDSGGMAVSGLYFEIRRNGQPQNPARWCDDSVRFRASL